MARRLGILDLRRSALDYSAASPAVAVQPAMTTVPAQPFADPFHSLRAHRPPAGRLSAAARAAAVTLAAARTVAAAAAAAAATLTLAGAAALAPAAAGAQDLAAFAARTTVHVVANGWTFILVERPVAPVFSFCTIADVGSTQEVPGITGLAHMFEHMAFKGTDRIGTRDPAGEKRAMDAQ